ncbi:MAG TPA: penicillin-binding protein 2 [Streptosporangiaceae bacterium]
MIPASRKRLVVLYVVLGALLGGLGYRAWSLQVGAHSQYVALASADRIRDIVQPPVRGEIVDDNGAPLISNASALVVSVNMSVLSEQPGGGRAELRTLAGLLGTTVAALEQKTRPCTAGIKPPCWGGSPYQPIPVAQHVSQQIAVQVLEDKRDLPGITAQVQPVTQYAQPVGTDAAQLLGYLQPITAAEVKKLGVPVTGFSGVDLVGQSGLEGQYDQQLRGTAGSDEVSVNAAGQITGTIKHTAAKAGDELVTSINTQLQVAVQNELAAAIQRTEAQGNAKARTGAAVVMTTTGRIVAMASYPTYNPAVWSGGISTAQFNHIFGAADAEPILDRATQGQYAPGSTWKVTSTAAAVRAGYPTSGQYNCPAATTIAGHSYANDGAPNLGPMTFRQALIVSCDTVFYNLAYDIWKKDHPRANDVTSPKAPVQEMQGAELKWGFGRPTGVDVSESSGTVPTREWLYYYWKDNAHQGQNWCKYGRENGSYVQQIEWDDCRSGNVWTPGQSVIASIGQGYVSVTPLQLANAYAALANGGTLYSPRIGEELVSPTGQVDRKITPPVIGHLPASKATLAYIRSALAGVVTSGTAAGAFGGFPEGQVCVAGKTGTAQVAGNLATSVFASFAPCGHPKYVVVVMIPDSGYGADVSAPAVRQIWDSIYGLEGHKAALPGGALPKPPRVNQAGQIVARQPHARKTKPAGAGVPSTGGVRP